MQRSEQLFDNGKPLIDKEKQEKERDELYQQIGQLKVENDWLKKKICTPVSASGG